jgi:hypothetical protein
MKTSIGDIVEYWESRESECGLGVDWAEAHERCWRCGYRTELQRCHIIPDALNGEDHPSNLVLLCQRCHREAPNISDPKYMWIWLRSNSGSTYDSFWTQKGFEEYERMFERKAFSEIEESDEALIKLKALLKKEMNNTVAHFGEGGLNPSTIACLIHKIEERFMGEKSSNNSAQPTR